MCTCILGGFFACGDDIGMDSYKNDGFAMIYGHVFFLFYLLVFWGGAQII